MGEKFIPIIHGKEVIEFIFENAVAFRNGEGAKKHSLSGREFNFFFVFLFDFYEFHFTFKSIDVNADNKITLNEFKKVADKIKAYTGSNKDIRTEFADADANGSGKLSFEEFLKWISLKQIKKLLNAEENEVNKVKGMDINDRIASTQGNAHQSNLLKPKFQNHRLKKEIVDESALERRLQD